jgi:hypothetical protein
VLKNSGEIISYACKHHVWILSLLRTAWEIVEIFPKIVDFDCIPW